MASHLARVQRSDEAVPLLRQPAQPTYGHFTHAHGFEIHGSQFYDIHGGFHHHSGKTGNETTLGLLSLPS